MELILSNPFLQVHVFENGNHQWEWEVIRPNGGGIVESGVSYSRVAAIHEGWACARWHEGFASRVINETHN